MRSQLSSSTSRNKTRLATIIVFTLILLYSTTILPVKGESFIDGTVVDELGNPIPDAQVSVWFGRSLVTATKTNQDGFFSMNVELDSRYSVLIFADLNETQGMDYLPSLYNLTSVNETFIARLHPAASVIISDDLQFVEIEDIPNNIVYAIYDSEGNIITLNGIQLIYKSNALLKDLIGLSNKHIIVPTNQNISLGVSSSIRIGQNIVEKTINITLTNLSLLDKGQEYNLEIKPYYVSYNIDIVDSLLIKVASIIDEMESLGFYMVTEKNSVASAEMGISESKILLSEGEYVDSYGALKRSYLSLIQNQGHLEYMLIDATYSVGIIIVFLSLTSTTVAFLLTNKNSYKVISSSILYAISLGIMYYTYPGSTVIPLDEFVLTSVASFLFAIFVAIIFPRYLKGRERDGIVPLRNILVPIFSMAKRSIRRRKLRFLLTLMSITLLVLSFVSLTSISEGYGVLQNRVSSNNVEANGLLLRANGYDKVDTVSLHVNELTSDWLTNQGETMFSSIKIENRPSPFYNAVINGLRIWGFIGVDADLEDPISGISGAIIEGEYPSFGGVAISQGLSERLHLGVNDELQYAGASFTITGILNDDYLEDMTEFDGSSFLPGKLVDMFPEEKYVVYERETCQPDEVLFFNLETSARFQKYDISRISIIVNNEFDQNEYGERLALERDYWVYSSSSDGLYFLRLGKYLEGKGLQLAIPWIVVVLNVVVTMLNSMFERKKEIQILSSLGLNPGQIATIFIAEAGIIGLTAGGIGYLAGMSLYKVLGFLGITLGVQQKVSATWSLASISISVASVLAGAFVALRGSVAITPSLTRKWSINSPEGGFLKPWTVSLPVRLRDEEVEQFVDFMVSALNKMNNDPVKSTSSVRVPQRNKERVVITFAHKGPSSTSGPFYTKNSLLIDRSVKNITVSLNSWGEREWVHETGTMVRMISMRWSTSPEKLNNDKK